MPTREEKDNFSIMIETKAEQLGIGSMDMVIEYCSRSGMELEVAASLLNPILKAKIEDEARNLRFLPKKGL
jgi:hypothetical protein